MFRIAFVGVDNPHGSGWRDLLVNLQDQIEIVAIVPGYDGATTSLEERYSHLPRFDSVEELLTGSEFDGAVVCLSNQQGPDVLCQLAAAGKHLLAEKPVAGSLEDARRIAAAVEQAGVAFQTGYNWRYDLAANRLREMVADGRFGKLISVEMTFVTSDVGRRGPDHYLFDPAVSEAGFFNWLACHFLDLLLYVTGQKVVGVTSRVGVFADTPVDVEDGGIALLDLSGGGVATFRGGYWVPRWAGEAHWCLRGSERWVHWDPSREGTGGVLEIHGPQPQWYATEEVFTVEHDETPGYGGRNGVALVNDWIQAAGQSGTRCRNTPSSMTDVLELIETIYQASNEGRRIECSIG